MTDTKQTSAPKIIFAASLFTALFWFTAQLVDVYHFAVTGAIFELLWLPMIMAIFVMPVVALVYWIVDKFRLKSLYFYSLLLLLATALFIYILN